MRIHGWVTVQGHIVTAEARLAKRGVKIAVELGACAAVLAAAMSGCSLVFSEGAPAGYQSRTSFLCGESWAPPILDTVGVGLFGLSALGDRSATASQEARRATLAVLVGTTVLLAGSAVYGYTAVGDCRAARAARSIEVARASRLPAPYGAPPDGAPPARWPPVPSGAPWSAPPPPSPSPP